MCHQRFHCSFHLLKPGTADREEYNKNLNCQRRAEPPLFHALSTTLARSSSRNPLRNTQPARPSTHPPLLSRTAVLFFQRIVTQHSLTPLRSKGLQAPL